MREAVEEREKKEILYKSSSQTYGKAKETQTLRMHGLGRRKD